MSGGTGPSPGWVVKLYIHIEGLLRDGFSRRHLAAMAGLPVATLQHWATRPRIVDSAEASRFMSLVNLIYACEVDSKAAWFEVPIDGLIWTPVDLISNGFGELAIRCSLGQVKADEVATVVKETIGSDIRGERSAFEVFRATDGNLGIRPRPTESVS